MAIQCCLPFFFSLIEYGYIMLLAFLLVLIEYSNGAYSRMMLHSVHIGNVLNLCIMVLFSVWSFQDNGSVEESDCYGRAPLI